jgi:replicative DNA helicase
LATKKQTAQVEKTLVAEDRSVIRLVKDAKNIAESNVISIFYKHPDKISMYDTLTIKDFSLNENAVRFEIAKAIVDSGKVLDPIAIGFYLEQHPKLKAVFTEHGGYDAISMIFKYVDVESLDSYVLDMKKWNTVLAMHRKGFPVTEEDVKTFKDITLEDIYHMYEVMLSNIFIHAESKVQGYNIAEGLHTILDDCDKGIDVGLPLYNAPYLTDITGGNMLGNITILGALSGTGKTTVTFELLFPSMITLDEQIVMIINEQDEKKLKKEMLAWVANNIFHADINKKRLRQGKFTEEEWEKLRSSADWLEEKREKRNITIVPLESYTVEMVKKIIKKYSALGVKYFVLDTFKASNSISNEQVWLNMMMDMQKLYDTIKPKGKNVHLWCTLQLKKDKMAFRHLTNDHIGMSKNIIDVASTVILMRGVRDDEKSGGANELKVFRLDGANKTTKIHVNIDPKKSYCILFITKNREGETNQYQIVAESDLGKNRYKDVGLTVVPEDF